MKGKISVGIFKVMAVVSALAIGGGYVAWRQVEADKVNKRERIEQAKAKSKDELRDIILLSGSKNPGGSVIGREITKEEVDAFLESYEGYIEQIPVVPKGAGDVQDVLPLLPGSKSISMPLFTKRHITKGLEIYDGHTVEVLPPPEDEKKLPELLPGSKSFLVIPIEAEPEKSE